MSPRKDQLRAQEAYRWAAEAKAKEKKKLKNYEIAVQTFAASLLGSGLAAAAAVLERNQEHQEYKLLLDHLQAFKQLPLGPGGNWPARVRAADVETYMLATREMIALVTWLVRACRALRSQEPDDEK